VPRASLYHAVSTGDAGFLGALNATRHEAPLLLTVSAAETPGACEESAGARELLRRAVFGRADGVMALSDEALRVAVRGGAPPERCRVVPRGIESARFAELRKRGRPTAEKESLVVACVGPIAPARDQKTFLRAAKLVIERLDLVDVLVVGLVADQAYFRECLLQAQMLGIDRLVRFTGPLDPAEILTELDCLCVSGTGGDEGDLGPLLKAMAAGVPCVATDAGVRRELILGRTPEDRELGAAGILCAPGDHGALAAAIVRCVRDQAVRERLVTTGKARVERGYRRERLEAIYLEAYEALGQRRGRL
jgi:glycosyltransferase involved in cell wall biosynthesis